jgi:AcrR family transcriptional regulator
LVASALRRKEDSRERLLAAAVNRFCEVGYAPVSVEEIAAEAGVSRVTFYRHFVDKAELAIDLFLREASAATPLLLSIRADRFEQREAVRTWLGRLFAADRENRRLLKVFMQATSDERFTQRAQQWIAELIRGLGESIPAFAARGDRTLERRRWLEAWLLLYEILDQSNHAALNSGVAGDPLVIDILTERFVVFVRSQSASASHA